MQAAQQQAESTESARQPASLECQALSLVWRCASRETRRVLMSAMISDVVTDFEKADLCKIVLDAAGPSVRKACFKGCELLCVDCARAGTRSDFYVCECCERPVCEACARSPLGAECIYHGILCSECASLARAKPCALCETPVCCPLCVARRAACRSCGHFVCLDCRAEHFGYDFEDYVCAGCQEGGLNGV